MALISAPKLISTSSFFMLYILSYFAICYFNLLSDFYAVNEFNLRSSAIAQIFFTTYIYIIYIYIYIYIYIIYIYINELEVQIEDFISNIRQRMNE